MRPIRHAALDLLEYGFVLLPSFDDVLRLAEDLSPSLRSKAFVRRREGRWIVYLEGCRDSVEREGGCSTP
jgi:hypothetical protein